MSSRGPGLGVVVVVSALTSAVVAAGIVLAIVRGDLLGRDEEVPDLTSLSIDGARQVLDARGLRLVQRGERHHPDVARGMIATQEPGARSVVRSGSEITVFVSLGPDRIDVPDLTGLPEIAASARLVNLGLRTRTQAGGDGEPGTVASLHPSAGTAVERDTEITLTIVPAPTRLTMPDLTGVPSRTARETITATGLVVGAVRSAFDDRRSPFVVLRQTPPPGTEVEPGTRVDLVINEE